MLINGLVRRSNGGPCRAAARSPQVTANAAAGQGALSRSSASSNESGMAMEASSGSRTPQSAEPDHQAAQLRARRAPSEHETRQVPPDQGEDHAAWERPQQLNFGCPGHRPRSAASPSPHGQHAREHCSHKQRASAPPWRSCGASTCPAETRPTRARASALRTLDHQRRARRPTGRIRMRSRSRRCHTTITRIRPRRRSSAASATSDCGAGGCRAPRRLIAERTAEIDDHERGQSRESPH